jgi:SAM-dependent methyltransferase
MSPAGDFDYERGGAGYALRRRPDPTIAALVRHALGDAKTLINVGAGAGSYEPPATMAAIEPSQVMIAQRPAGSAPVLRAVAEQIPLRDNCADAAMALLTVHHWADVAAGVAEMRRIARRRLVFLTWRPDVLEQFWLSRYLPEAARLDAAMAVPVGVLTAELRSAQVRPLPIPHDCLDGFGAAFWRRPHAYLDPVVRAGISFFAKAGSSELREGLGRLADDLATGRWHDQNAELLELDSYDAGYCLITSDS